MSRGAASVIVFILILLLTAFLVFSPRIFSRKNVQSSELFKELLVKRFTSLGNSVAHSSFVEDAVIMGEEANLIEIIARLRKDEPELRFIHITDAENKVLASSDSAMVGKFFDTKILATGTNIVRERNGLYEGGFSIDIGQKRVGVLYFGANPRMSAMQLPSDVNSLAIIVGVVFAIIAFVVTVLSGRRIRAKLVDEMNRHQEEMFSPKIESLKRAQSEAQIRLNEVNDQIRNAESELHRFAEEYELQKREAQSNPLVQSVEKLKAAEVNLIKRLDDLKEEEAQLNTEISLLSQKREEVLSALEIEKREERTLHEKLDLIKKKILHLETPGK